MDGLRLIIKQHQTVAVGPIHLRTQRNSQAVKAILARRQVEQGRVQLHLMAGMPFKLQ